VAEGLWNSEPAAGCLSLAKQRCLNLAERYSLSAIIQDLLFWGGNESWASMAGVAVADLIGMGIENVLHPDCIVEVL